MLYDIQYDIAAVIGSIFLLSIYMMRRSYKSKSNRLLMAMIWLTFIAAAADIASAYTISYPDRYSTFGRYASALTYLFAYNMMGIMFFAYVDSKAKIVKMWKATKIICVLSTIYIAVVIFSSPWTKLVAYFDEDLKYCHGPLFKSLFVLAALSLIGAVILYTLGHRRFNTYQFVTMLSFVFTISCCVIIQGIWPRVAIGQFGCVMVLYFIYNAFENPVYFTYKDTRCYNQEAFLKEIKTRHRADKKYSVMCITIEDFDFIKSNLSLKDVDRLTARVAEFIYYNFGANGYVLDNNKFVIILRKNMVRENAERIIDMFFHQPIRLVTTDFQVYVSHTYIADINSSYDMEFIAEAINYVMEHTGSTSNVVEDFDEVIKSLKRNQMIVHKLDAAVNNWGFDVFYQPIIDSNSRVATSVEALVRLKDMSDGFISPEEFIPIAELNGYIKDIGEIVFTKVCQFIQYSGCIERGVKYVEINMSPVQLSQEGIVERFSEIMAEYHVEPAWINLEITETAAVEKSRIMSENIEKFREMGVSFSLDDFGTGFSSADYLIKLPVEIVKIDKGILWNAMKNEEAMVVLLGTMMMVKQLKKRIVVEGVENEIMVELLSANNCDYMQGYYYSRPVPETDYIEFLKKFNNY